jgi:hypothetical protein
MGFFTTSHMKFQMCEDNKRSKENYWLTCTEVDTYALKPFWSRHFLGTHNAKGELTWEIFWFWDSVLTMKTHNGTDVESAGLTGTSICLHKLFHICLHTMQRCAVSALAPPPSHCLFGIMYSMLGHTYSFVFQLWSRLQNHHSSKGHRWPTLLHFHLVLHHLLI